MRRHDEEGNVQRSTEERETVKRRGKEEEEKNMTRKVWNGDRRECMAPESADITVNHGDENKNENFSKRTSTKINK